MGLLVKNITYTSTLSKEEIIQKLNNYQNPVITFSFKRILNYNIETAENSFVVRAKQRHRSFYWGKHSGKLSNTKVEIEHKIHWISLFVLITLVLGFLTSVTLFPLLDPNFDTKNFPFVNALGMVAMIALMAAGIYSFSVYMPDKIAKNWLQEYLKLEKQD